MTNLKRKLLVILLAMLCSICLVFGLTACDELDNTVDGTTNQGTEDDGSGSGSADDGSGTTDDGSGSGGGTTDDGSGSGGGTTEDPDASGNTDYDISDLLIYDGLTVIIKDVSISMPFTTYVDVTDGSSMVVTGTQSVTFDAGELYVKLVETEDSYTVLAYADGEITSATTVSGVTYESTTLSATLYGDGETLYLLYSETTGTETDEEILKVSYQYIIDTITEAVTSDEELMSYITEISAQVEGLLSGETEIDSSVLQLIEVIGGYSEDLGTIITALSDSLFTTDVTFDGIVMALDLTAIETLVDNAYTLTCSQFVDEYLGEDTYATIGTYIAALGSQNLFDVITGLTTATGLDTETVYALVDMVVEYITGEEFDLAAILSGDGTVESQYQILLTLQAMTVDEFLTEYAGVDTADIVTMLNTYGDVTLFSIMYPDATEAAAVYATVSSILAEISDSLTFSITMLYDGNIQLLMALDGFELDNEYIAISVNGEITITTGAEIPSDAADIVTTIAEKTSALDGADYMTCTIHTGSDYSSIYAFSEDGDQVYSYYVTDYYTYYTTYNDNGDPLYDYYGYGEEWYEYTYTYDENGDLLTVNYLDSDEYTATTTYTYDGNGNELSMKYETSEGYSYTVTYTYDENGNKATETYEDEEYSYTTAYTYEEHGWEASVITTYSDGSVYGYYCSYEILYTEEYDFVTAYYVAITETDLDGNIAYEYDTWLYVWYE